MKLDEQEACLKRVIVKEKSDLNQLRNEVDTMKRLVSSAYVVRYYDSNAQKLDSGLYEVLLLMEYCPNGSLLDYMNQHIKTKLTVDRITRIMCQIAVALGDMHSLKLIHRDLKIENVLRDAHGVFKLADFGSTSGFIAPPQTQEEVQLIANDIIRNTTPQYRAPEMIDLYKNLPIDDKSDIWALGVFLYKLMYYTTPFERQGEIALLHGYFEFPEQPQYPSRLKNLVIIMLQVTPLLRPNAYQVLHEVCAFMNIPVPIEDRYQLGPYDFDAYARYQEHMQHQQQKQAELEKKYLEQKRLEQTTNKAPSDEPEPTHGQYDEIRPQELTRSSKSSVGDLKLLNDNLEEADDGSNPELDNVENRFPRIDDLDKDLESKYPLPTGKSSDGKSMGSIADGTSTKESSECLEPGHPENMAFKLTKTEAWEVPPNETDLVVDVFRKAEEKILPQTKSPNVHESGPVPVQSPVQPAVQGPAVAPAPAASEPLPDRPPIKPLSSFENLFNVDTTPKSSLEISRSRNPFPTSKNPFPRGDTFDGKNYVPSQPSGTNPWAQYSQSYEDQYSVKHTQSAPQSILQQSVLGKTLPQQQHSQQQPQPTLPPAQLPQIHVQPPPQAHLPKQRTQPQQTQTSDVLPKVPPRPKAQSKSDGGPLVALGNPHEHRPRLDLGLQDMDIGGDRKRNVYEDTDTDSGDLKVEVMKVRSSKNARSPRSSAELQRLKFTMEELDLEEDGSMSRNSLNLRRSTSRKTSKQENRKSWFKS